MAQFHQRDRKPRDLESSEFEERVVEISRVSRVVKGGRRIRFRMLVVIGDRKGRVGYGQAKANEIAVGVKKAVSQAKKHLINVPIVDDTIPYEICKEFGSAKIILKPASQGTSIVAGGVIRIVAELAGIKNMLSKIIGTANKANNVKAIFSAFESFDADKIARVKERFESKNKLLEKKPDLIKKSSQVDAKSFDTPLEKSEVGVPTENVGKQPDISKTKAKKMKKDEQAE